MTKATSQHTFAVYLPPIPPEFNNSHLINKIPRKAVIGIGSMGGRLINKLIDDPRPNLDEVILWHIDQQPDTSISPSISQLYIDHISLNEYKKFMHSEGISMYQKIRFNEDYFYDRIFKDIEEVVFVCGLGGETGGSYLMALSELCEMKGIPFTIICSFPFEFSSKCVQYAKEVARFLIKKGYNYHMFKCSNLPMHIKISELAPKVEAYIFNLLVLKGLKHK